MSTGDHQPANTPAGFPQAECHLRQVLNRSVGLGLFNFLCALGVAAVLHLLGPWPRSLAYEGGWEPYGGFAAAVLLAVGLAPLAETLLLGLLYGVFSTAFPARISACLAGLAMAAAHALKGWPAAVCVTIPFLVMAAPFASPSLSWRCAAGQSMGIHVVHNTCVVLVLALLEIA